MLLVRQYVGHRPKLFLFQITAFRKGILFPSSVIGQIKAELWLSSHWPSSRLHTQPLQSVTSQCPRDWTARITAATWLPIFWQFQINWKRTWRHAAELRTLRSTYCHTWHLDSCTKQSKCHVFTRNVIQQNCCTLDFGINL